MIKPPILSSLGLLVAGVCRLGLGRPSLAGAAPGDTNEVATAANAPAPASPVILRKLSGAELYSMHCNRCHAERYPTERTAAQWKTIMLHMQIRANLPGEQARRILQYLQENSGR